MLHQQYHRIKKYWLSDASFITLLLVLLFLNFVAPVLIDQRVIGEYSLNIIYLFLFLVGIFSSNHYWFKTLTLIFFSLHVILRLIRFSDTPTEFYFWEQVVMLMNFILLILVNLNLLFRDKEVNYYRIIGAVNVYLMMGLIGVSLLELVHTAYGSSIQGSWSPEEGILNFPKFMYYSLTSLTTVGYGDLVPANTAARMTSVFLSAIGILYPAVVISRLISVEFKKDAK
jgi:hypothetical protein